MPHADRPRCQARSTRRSSTGSRACRWSRARSSRASWPGSTARRSAAARSSSRSTASTCPATSCAASTGRSSRARDRLVVKQYVEETNLDCHLLVDASESMAFGSLAWTQVRLRALVRGGAGAPGARASATRPASCCSTRTCATRSRPATARRRSASIARRRSRQAEPRGPTRHRRGAELDRAQPAPARHRGDLLRLLRRARARSSRACGAWCTAATSRSCSRCSTRRSSSFDFDRLLRLDGLEGAGVHKVDPQARSARPTSRRSSSTTSELARAGARAVASTSCRSSTATPLDAALSTYLAHRMARARGGRR